MLFIQPPVSLHGQLYFREWFYYLGYTVPNFDQMENNRICLQVNWNRDPKFIDAFEKGMTGKLVGILKLFAEYCSMNEKENAFYSFRKRNVC